MKLDRLNAEGIARESRSPCGGRLKVPESQEHHLESQKSNGSHQSDSAIVRCGL